MVILVIFLCSILGALGRRLQGGWFNGFRWTAFIVYAVVCLALARGASDSIGVWPGLLLAAALYGLSVAWLTIKTDNGGGGRPLRRYGPFGLGYWWADRYRPEWHAALGEPFLGGSWFGLWAVAAWVWRMAV